jgi:uncharacterized protein (DUF2384 family)
VSEYGEAWARHRPIDRAEVWQAAIEVIRPEFVDQWLATRNQLLDGHSPDELIAAGDGRRVLDLIDFLASGSFA